MPGPVVGAAPGGAAASGGAGQVALERLRWWHLPEVMAVETEAFGATAWSEATYWSELAQPASRWYVAARDTATGSLLGYAGLMVQDTDADVQTVAVAAAARGRGLGRTLLRELCEQARRRGATSMMLEVRADNDAAAALYLSEGFTRIGVRRAYYQPGDVDAWVMRRRPL